MKLAVTLLMLPLIISSCSADETLAGHGGGDGRTWELVEIDGVAFPASATIIFGAKGQVAGRAPCNGYGATQNAPYPWFGLTNIISTQIACSDIDAETDFFSALTTMTLSEVSGPVLVLSDDNGRSMVFRAD
jgi:heat shock protein HslJ